MTVFIKAGDTIEGNEVRVQTRKWTPGSLVRHAAVNKQMMRYCADRNSSAEVKKTFPEPNDPKIKEATASYHREVGDSLTCDSMKVYVDNKRVIRTEHVGGATHRHGAQVVETKDHTIATISTPLENLQKKIAENEHKTPLIPEVKQLKK